MSNVMKFCGCRACRSGMHRSSRSGCEVKMISRKFRRMSKIAISRGEEPPTKISVPYTD